MSAKSYRKKPVTIKASQVKREGLSGIETAEWMVENGYPWLVGNALYPEQLRDPAIEDEDHVPTKGIWIDPDQGSLMIRTLEGDMRVSVGDFVIQGVSGEFYPCKPDIFDKTYEEVDD